MFKDIYMPPCLSLDLSVTRTRRTESVTALSGDVYASEKWAFSRRSFRAAWGPKTLDEVQTFLSFWENVTTVHTFRVRDWSDYTSALPGEAITDADQAIGIGDGAQTDFQLAKTYGYSGETYAHPIYAPVPGSVMIAFDGVNQSSGWSVNSSSGIVSFNSAPATGVVITAGYEYDIKSRFENDAITMAFRARHLGEIDTFTLIENPN